MNDDILELMAQADTHSITIEIPVEYNIKQIGLDFNSNITIIQMKNTYYFIDEYGVVQCSITNDKIENITNFQDGLARIKKNGTVFFIDKKGNTVIDCSKYKMIGTFSEGLVPVKMNNSWYFIDKSGNIAIDCSKYDEIYSFIEGLAPVKMNNSWYFIDKSGNVAIDCSEYDEIYNFSEGLANVKKNNSWYFIDKSGNVAIDCSKYDETYKFSEGLARVKMNNSWYFIDKSGKIVIDCSEYEVISPFKNGYYIAAKNNKIYFFDKQGNVITNPNNLYYSKNEIEFHRGKNITAIWHEDNITFISIDQEKRIIKQPFTRITIKKEFKTLIELRTYIESLPSDWKILKYQIGKNIDGRIHYTNADKVISDLEHALKSSIKSLELKKFSHEETSIIDGIIPKQNSKNSSEYIKSFIERIQKKFLHQENAISLLCANIFANKKVIETKDRKLIRNQKSNILLDGPSGTGKSAILHEIADELDIPIVDVSITDYTPAGYAGADLSEIIKQLIKKSDNDIEKAQRGIIILDEFDKLSSKKYKDQHNTDEDSFRKKLQNEILTYLGGGKVTVSLGLGETIEFDTSQITFICAGAFTDLRETAGDNFTQEDLTENGFSQELVGRLNTFISTKSYTIEEYKDILINSPISPLTAFASFCKLYNINDFVFMPDFLDEVAKEAYDLDLGVRGLQQIINRVKNFYLTDIVLGNKTQIILTKSIVELSKEKGR